MTLRDLSRLDLKRQQYRAILHLAEGEATFEELCQALGVSRTRGYEALSLLVRWGLVEKVNGRYRLNPALGKGGNRTMPPKSLDPLKDLARAGLRASEYQVLLYLAAAGEAGLEEVMEELGFKRAWARAATGLSGLGRFPPVRLGFSSEGEASWGRRRGEKRSSRTGLRRYLPPSFSTRPRRTRGERAR
jgi:DNA-binding MarR family transcriptional regulator